MTWFLRRGQPEKHQFGRWLINRLPTVSLTKARTIFSRFADIGASGMEFANSGNFFLMSDRYSSGSWGIATALAGPCAQDRRTRHGEGRSRRSVIAARGAADFKFYRPRSGKRPADNEAVYCCLHGTLKSKQNLELELELLFHPFIGRKREVYHGPHPVPALQ
jgi:hypothetical protein